MIEVTGNLWTYPADVRVITTNGTVKRNGECVMGRGCAHEAKQRWPQMPRLLGEHILTHGNHVGWLFGDNSTPDTPVILSFPVKHEWHQTADLDLIAQSAKELLAWAGGHPKVVVLPRPGCGNGNLRWEDVRPVLADILDERFHVITF